MSPAATPLPRLRILLAHHAPLHEGIAGREARRGYDALRQAGHQVRLLLVAGAAQGAANHERWIVSNPHDADADLEFHLPAFATLESGKPFTPFDELSERQLLEYRDALRMALDAEMGGFDPHVVHAQHAWLLGHAALEAGVPYVLSVWPDELEALSKQARFRRMAHEAAENAGGLFVPDEATRRRAIETFDEVDPERFVVPDGALPLVEQLEAAYREALGRRFGGTIPP